MSVKEKEIDREKLREYNIYAGLGGSFGGGRYLYTSVYPSEEEATEDAYQNALQEYESYSGVYQGLATFEEAMDEVLEENGLEDIPSDIDAAMELSNIANEVYLGYAEDWISYNAVLTEEDDIDEEDLIRDYIIEDDNDSCETACE